MTRSNSSQAGDSYYTVIKGKKYDRRMLELAEGLTSGRGDGRISIADAKNLLRVVKDANNYSATEKLTMEYIRKHYKFTKEGDEFFRSEIRKWAANKSAGKKTKAAKAPKPSAKKSAEAAPIAVAPTAQSTSEPQSAAPAVSGGKKSSAIMQILLGLLLLIAAAVIFYFIAYKSGCAKTENNPPVTSEPSTTPAPAPAATPVPAEAAPQPAAATPSAPTPAFKDYVEKVRLGFVAEKTELTPETLKALDELAEKMKSENSHLRITGHTCSLGPKSLNQLISEKRANLVKEALVARGIAADRLETRGVADTEPAGDNKTVPGRALNRRVTFNVIQK
ncbi:OmpA family protein [Turneriella parva]|uniref:OmpA/MotB domain protein n=1 Tax=Turneriella parva (strain ATCC BAA-1111 / DSM 21527 / NCTC 11395 / H) TaxID=869212 RepID=I4B577_TURPD|nr:OmpA family protein [Turneriella parva]AFM12434.1 OmpA/MotB domain protein [Turneriella parva DSM 21527]